jgi:septal ring factor EnvC (AmiA/AmiB activator)
VSVLTKLFVVLLIICSLLMTAAMVVFVNRTEDFHRAATLAEERALAAQRQKATAENDANVARQREAEAIATANGKVSDLQARITQMGQEVAAKDAEINDLKTKAAVAQGTITEQAAGLKTMGQNVTSVSERNKALTEENDKLRLTNAELVGANTDYTKRLEEALRELRFANEQLSQARADLARRPEAPKNGARAAVATPDLKGVVRSVKTDEGRTFAEISLGSQQKVEKGMEFFVIDDTEGSFLAKFIVDSVDPDSSFGRLEGPRVQNVKRDNVVLSKL